MRLLKEHEGTVIVDLDGTSGYGSSFLDEAFGGLVRTDGFHRSVEHRFRFISNVDPTYIDEIRESFQKAVPDRTDPA